MVNRLCPRDCPAPRPYGGGLIREFQVRCFERACGVLSMEFELLNARGESLETLKLHENDPHPGEQRRFDVDSVYPQAAACRPIELVARARASGGLPALQPGAIASALRPRPAVRRCPDPME